MVILHDRMSPLGGSLHTPGGGGGDHSVFDANYPPN